MTTTLWEELMGTSFTDDNDHKLIEWLDEQGIHVEYSKRANDRFFVYLYMACYSPFDGLIEPIDLKESCHIIRDLTQDDGQVYDVTFRFPNGYDLSYSFNEDGQIERKEIYVTGGKCVTDAPVMQLVTAEDNLSVIDALESVPSGAHFITDFECCTSTDEFLKNFRYGDGEPMTWQEYYDTDNWDDVKEDVERQRQKLRQKYSS